MISIVTSLYRSDRYLKNYIASIEKFSSVMATANTPFEIVAIANDPTALEQELLNATAAKHPWFRFLSVAREPLYATWNRGVREARYKVIGFWNVDDVRFPEAVISGLESIKSADLVYFPFIYKRYLSFGPFKILVKRKVIQPPAFTKEEFSRSMHCGPFFIFKKSFYTNVGPFDEQFKIAGDFDWCVRAALVGTFVRSDAVGGIFTNEGRSLTGSNNPRQVTENNIVYQKNNIQDKITQ